MVSALISKLYGSSSCPSGSFWEPHVYFQFGKWCSDNFKDLNWAVVVSEVAFIAYIKNFKDISWPKLSKVINPVGKRYRQKVRSYVSKTFCMLLTRRRLQLSQNDLFTLFFSAPSLPLSNIWMTTIPTSPRIGLPWLACHPLDLRMDGCAFGRGISEATLGEGTKQERGEIGLMGGRLTPRRVLQNSLIASSSSFVTGFRYTFCSTFPSLVIASICIVPTFPPPPQSPYPSILVNMDSSVPKKQDKSGKKVCAALSSRRFLQHQKLEIKLWFWSLSLSLSLFFWCNGHDTSLCVCNHFYPKTLVKKLSFS